MSSPYHHYGDAPLRQRSLDAVLDGEPGADDVHIMVVEGRTLGRLAMVCSCGWRSRLGAEDAIMDDAFLHSMHMQDSGSEVWLLTSESG